MTASFTIRASELSCWSANAVSRSWLWGSKREWIGTGGGLFRGRRIMPDFDSFWFIYQPYMGPWPGCPPKCCGLASAAEFDFRARSVPTTERDGSETYTRRDKSGLNWYV